MRVDAYDSASNDSSDPGLLTFQLTGSACRGLLIRSLACFSCTCIRLNLGSRLVVGAGSQSLAKRVTAADTTNTAAGAVQERLHGQTTMQLPQPDRNKPYAA